MREGISKIAPYGSAVRVPHERRFVSGLPRAKNRLAQLHFHHRVFLIRGEL
jgi:hypothetical protein